MYIDWNIVNYIIKNKFFNEKKKLHANLLIVFFQFSFTALEDLSIQARAELITTSDISDRPIAQSTAIGHSSFEASTTRARNEKAAIDLRENQNFDSEVPVYMCEEDLNSLMQEGCISFVNGKFQYKRRKLH